VCEALVEAAGADEAIRRTEEIWGPLSQCACTGEVEPTRVDAVLGGHRIGASPVPFQKGVPHVSC